MENRMIMHSEENKQVSLRVLVLVKNDDSVDQFCSGEFGIKRSGFQGISFFLFSLVNYRWFTQCIDNLSRSPVERRAAKNLCVSCVLTSECIERNLNEIHSNTAQHILLPQSLASGCRFSGPHQSMHKPEYWRQGAGRWMTACMQIVWLFTKNHSQSLWRRKLTRRFS